MKLNPRLPDAVTHEARLAAVQATGLLDTPPEESFDRLTALAARLLDVPAAFVSLVDEGRDFYKSNFGFPEPLATTRQLEGTTFCHFAVRSTEPLVINDTLADPRYRDVPTVASLGVRAYAGIPLVVKSGQIIGSFCVIDVAPRQWTKREIEVLDDLAQSALREIELRGALREGERLVSALARSNQDLADFAYATSHDLKGPLRGIVGLADALEEDVGPKLPPASRRQLTTLRERAVRLHDLLDGILHYSRAITERPPEEVVDSGAVIAGVIELLAPPAGAKIIVRGDLPSISANLAALQQIFINLVGNAIKHAGDAPVTVTVHARPLDAGHEFFVEDDGPGIPAKYHQRVWSMLTRLDPKIPGNGIGLSLVKKLVEMRGGQVGLISEGPGASFHFTWPAHAA